MGVRPAESAFIGSHHAKVDAKGRIALPADFRRALDPKRDSGFWATPNLIEPDRLDCGGPDFVERLKKRVSRFKPYSEERNALESTLMHRMRPVPLDADGRFILPAALKEQAQITDGAYFVGRYDIFQIRNRPETVAQTKEHEKIARDLAPLLYDDEEEDAA
jgi:MraZ protein